MPNKIKILSLFKFYQVQHTMSDNNSEKVFDIKWIDWNEKKTAIVMQNVNGPCPLLALINVLLLSNKV